MFTAYGVGVDSWWIPVGEVRGSAELGSNFEAEFVRSTAHFKGASSVRQVLMVERRVRCWFTDLNCFTTPAVVAQATDIPGFGGQSAVSRIAPESQLPHVFGSASPRR